MGALLAMRSMKIEDRWQCENNCPVFVVLASHFVTTPSVCPFCGTEDIEEVGSEHERYLRKSNYEFYERAADGE